MKKRVIIDCDPGIDDALALIYALKSEKIDVRAVTTVMGNAPLALTTANALKILELTGRVEVPVAKGADKPLRGSYRPSTILHGADGLGNTDLPLPKIKEQPIEAAELILSEAERSDGPLTLIQLGPLTNLATALQKVPEIVDSLEEVVVMGGAINVPGNVASTAEFNIHLDPEAARIVFDSGLRITLVPLDVTRKTLVQPGDLEALEHVKNPVTQFAFRAMKYYTGANRRVRGVEGCFLHDPLAVAIAEDRTIAQTKRLKIEVVTGDRPDRGRLISAELGSSPPKQTIQVCLDVDAEGFLHRFFERITTLD